MNEQRKVYTLDDNVKSISFGIKDVVKQLQETNKLLYQVIEMLGEKKVDQNDCPF